MRVREVLAGWNGLTVTRAVPDTVIRKVGHGVALGRELLGNFPTEVSSRRYGPRLESKIESSALKRHVRGFPCLPASEPQLFRRKIELEWSGLPWNLAVFLRGAVAKW